MFRGFATINFYADDMAAAKDWYTKLLGVEAYYAYPHPPAAPAYMEFRLGDDEDEFGFIDRRYAPSGASNAPGGAVMYWHVDDLTATLEKLLGMGATEYQPVTEHGDAGFIDRVGGRPVRQRPGHHAQPALPRGACRQDEGVTALAVPVWAACRRSYRPFCDSSSWCVPVSTSRP